MTRRRRNRPARRLRVSIDALPRATKLAMLQGIRETPIIAGAYTSREGTCPMLAAHRRGGRTSLATFARAWDGYTRAERGPRPATERELRTLEAMLEASLAGEEGDVASELRRAIAEHEEARARREAPEVAGGGDKVGHGDRPARERPAARSPRSLSLAAGDRDRTPELRRRPGWAWLRVFRRLDDYEKALAEAEGRAADSAVHDEAHVREATVASETVHAERPLAGTPH